MKSAQHVSRGRGFILGCGALLALFMLTSTPAVAGASPAHGTDAGISIVNGETTSIAEWPWQVALTVNRRVRNSRLTSHRFFCGGSVLAPRLVVTAGHCVANLHRRDVRNLEVVSGRTNLNSKRGQVAKVAKLRMPLRPNGARRYRDNSGAPDWDVALLVLRSPLAAEPIKLAGPDESDAWSAGHTAWSTGWGSTRSFPKKVSTRLRVARQVLMPDGLCEEVHGDVFKVSRMLCIGDPDGRSSLCNGDSGGPLAVETSDGLRLVGMTSFGISDCRGSLPAVNVRVSDTQIRNWVARTALTLTGRDVVGSGAVGSPVPEWCEVPDVIGRSVSQAGQRLEAAGCHLGKVRKDRQGTGRSGTVINVGRVPGWLASLGSEVNVWTAP